MQTSLFCLVVWLGFQLSLAIHKEVGEPLVFATIQEDVSVFETDADGNTNNLVLSCDVMGDPVRVTWFRGGTPVNSSLVQADGSLLIVNITEGEYASRDGVVYYCEATREIGDTPFNATIRSRDITVTYSFFGGFEDLGEVFVVTGSPVDFAVRCDVLDSHPPPEIVWFNGDTQLEFLLARIQFLEGGRYLYIRELQTTPETYRCGVTNALGDRTMMSGTIYMVNGTGLADTGPHVYKTIGDLSAFEIDLPDFMFSYVAAIGMSPQSCTFRVGDTSVSANGGLANIGGPITIDQSPVTLSCTNNGATIATGSLTVNRRASITTPPVSQREVIVGRDMAMFDCTSTGSPSPTVTWYFNGAPADGTTGVTINGGLLTIVNPKVSHSGMYQCFVSNGVSQDSAAVLLEVRNPVVPCVEALVNSSNPSAINDRQVGALFIGAFESEVTVNAMVVADPCPETFMWSFRGESLAGNDLYTMTNPCSDPGATSPFLFTLTLSNLSNDTSGAYSASFTNLGGTGELPRLYLTIPMMPDEVLSGISVSVDNESAAMCLLNNTKSRITCNVNGFPRPSVRFFRSGSSEITPGSGDFTAFSLPFPDELLISNVVEGVEGIYGCEATPPTPPGQTTDPPFESATEDFEFCTTPRVISMSATPNTVERDTLTLECEIIGIPEPIDRWEKDGVVLEESEDGALAITNPSNNPQITRLRINSAQLSDTGSYSCIGSNLAGEASHTFLIDVSPGPFGPLTQEQIIGIAAGGAGAILLVVLIILLMVCVYMCARRKKGSMDLQPSYHIPGSNYPDYAPGDGRGNVDRDSDEEDGGKPEAFNPEYESLPALRPAQPPMYKPTPSYPHGAPLGGDDLEMIKVPPPDNDSFVGYRRDNVDYRPSPDDFLSEDAQFV